MFKEYPVLYMVSQGYLYFVFVLLALMFLLIFVRIIRGPGAADRLLGVNVLGGLSISAIVILSLISEESYLLDVALVYSIISFLSVAILTKLYIGAALDIYERRSKHSRRRKKKKSRFFAFQTDVHLGNEDSIEASNFSANYTDLHNAQDGKED